MIPGINLVNLLIMADNYVFAMQIALIRCSRVFRCFDDSYVIGRYVHLVRSKSSEVHNWISEIGSYSPVSIMDILPQNFRTLFCSGVWHEEDETFSATMLIYRVFVGALMIYSSVVQAVELLRPTSFVDMSESLVLTLTFVSLVIKWLNILVRRNHLINLLDQFRSSICQPRSLIERDILEKYSRSAARNHSFLWTLGIVYGLSLVIRPLIRFEKEIQLPFRTYQPFDVSSTVQFTVAYVIQGLAEIYSASINSSFDTLTYGFMILVSGQFEVCYHRLTLSIDSGDFAEVWRDSVDHHNLIQEIIHKIESFFLGIVAPFFMATMVTLCTNVLKMSQVNFGGVEFLLIMIYFTALLFETFLYCSYGNKLHLKSRSMSEAVYNSDWTKLDPRERKNLLLVMMVGQKGSTISFRGQFTLTLDTFVWILKTSYGAFNLVYQISI